MLSFIGDYLEINELIGQARVFGPAIDPDVFCWGVRPYVSKFTLKTSLSSVVRKSSSCLFALQQTCPAMQTTSPKGRVAEAAK